MARGEDLKGPVRDEAAQGGAVAQKVCWEDLGKAPFSGTRPGGALPIMVVLDWMGGSQSLKKAVAGLTQERRSRG